MGMLVSRKTFSDLPLSGADLRMRKMTISTQENSKEKVGVGVQADTPAQVQAEMSRGAVRALALVGGLVALWAAACVVGAMVSAGGPLALVKGWFSAVMGL